MLSALIGLISAWFGLWGVWVWRVELVNFLKGALPISLFFIGLVAVIAGLSNRNRKDEKP